MRLDGDGMVVGMKDVVKLLGITAITFCAVFVCTLFLNFNMDILLIADQISSGDVRSLYDAVISSGKVISAVSGGCLLLTSVIMLFFYIKHHIDTHGRELGILKALGYSNLKIAKSFWVFGISVLLGTAGGFGSSFLLMPVFYRIQNEDGLLPEYSIHFHPLLAVFLVVLPTVVFALLAVCYAFCKLKRPVPELLREKKEENEIRRKRRKSEKDVNLSFLEALRKDTVKSRKTLVFFIVFASFCFSSMMQMSFSMEELSSFMFVVMIILICMVLSCTTLFLAITTVVNSNVKMIAMMKVMGYSLKECQRAILGGYRPAAYIGFAIGTVYQYMLVKTIVSVVFRDLENIPEYSFDFPALIIVLVAFVLIYELIMYCYLSRMKKISVKEIMLE